MGNSLPRPLGIVLPGIGTGLAANQISPAVAKQLHNQYQKSPDRAVLLKKKGARLSSREGEVLQLIAEGQANKQVAMELGISVKTVEKHRQRLMEKLNIHDTAGLTRYAISGGHHRKQCPVDHCVASPAVSWSSSLLRVQARRTATARVKNACALENLRWG
jgi:DNA-binding CsgD family transcriptional regulator